MSASIQEDFAILKIQENRILYMRSADNSIKNISLSTAIAISESVKCADGIAFDAIIRKGIIKSYELYGRRCWWKSVVLDNHMTAHVHRKCCFVFMSRYRFKCVIRCAHLCFVGFLHLSVIFHVLFHGTELLSRGRGRFRERPPKDLSVVTPKA